MSEAATSPEDQEAVEALINEIAQSLANGARTEDVVQNLVEEGMAREQAEELVSNINQQVTNLEAESFKNEDSGAGGWLLWIGALVGINLLSWIFDWPFFVY